MIKKITLFGLCCFLLFALTACGKDANPSSPTSSSPTSTPTPDIGGENTEEEGNGDGNPDEIDIPELSNTHNEALVGALTPDDAVVHTDIESMLALTSQKPMAELTAFCLEAANELGATQESIDDSKPDLWTYTGSLGEGLPLIIELRDEGNNGVTMLVNY